MNQHDSQQLFRKMNHRRGFSLIELLIVMLIVLILAVITVPNLMRARIFANESSSAEDGLLDVFAAQHLGGALVE